MDFPDSMQTPWIFCEKAYDETIVKDPLNRHISIITSALVLALMFSFACKYFSAASAYFPAL
jgi:hypothetical protein